ncbi:SDR family oxidoreductase [Rathayibacter sp. VKM Ac-2760]|uniref:SDR family NAD(P)-dependent oxidoreductase n=1 Tax=Rathayibacter sp. VKM Ac-2760 TaxID=2609253 RepID=UPI0013197BFB|nr:SDR family oxidoreductase [Rathayibacter sp. VKM Ac-2760]QHC61049.1 SDR family oxidoreductase [Rathayibacter sp. VKM Ac-2760]
MTAHSGVEGLVAIVTGGASGIGAECAALLAERGAEVAVLDRSVDTVDPGLFAVTCDVTDRASVDTAIALVLERFGRLDIVVNNAGIGAVGTVEESDEDTWRRVLDVNVVGVARISAAALPALRASDSASIVNLCSVASTSGLPQRAVYSASKAAVYGLTLAMATDHVDDGVRVNCVNPGTVHTGFVDQNLRAFADPDAELQALNRRQPIGRMITVREVAEAVVFLAGRTASSITGTSLAVDGGMDTLRVRR